MTDDVTQLIAYRPASHDALWGEVFDGYMIFNSNAVQSFASTRLQPRDRELFDKGVDFYNAFVAGLAKSIRKPMPMVNDAALRSYVKTNDAVLPLIQSKLEVLDNLIVKRKLSLSIMDLLHHFATQAAFSKAQNNFQRAKTSFSSIRWNLREDDGAVNVSSLSESGLRSLLNRLTVSAIKELILPQLNQSNAKRTLDMLAEFPLKAYHRDLLPRISTLFLSDKIAIIANDIVRGNPTEYWSQMPRDKVRQLLGVLDNSSLAKIAPFLNLTVREIEQLNLYFDSQTIKLMGQSKFPSVRAYWIAARQSAVLPALYIYNRRGYTMSPQERNLLGIYGGQLSLAEASVRNVMVPKGFRFFAWPQVPADIIESWRRFELSSQPWAYFLDLDPIGVYLKEGAQSAVVVYRTIYGDLDSSRSEDECLGYYVYSKGVMSQANPDPRKDKPVSLSKWQATMREAVELARTLEMRQS